MIDPRTICEQAGVRFIAENHGTATFADPQSGETLTLYTFACDAENVRLTLKNALILFDPEPRRLRPYLFLAGSGASCSSFEPPPAAYRAWFCTARYPKQYLYSIDISGLGD